ncbi:hypothetical protein NDU88_010097 [Pleurodeles waltl]|uniref:Uncharacterized protein n=1 Tax=Pleurodeles waltl TaxID=8319 RepID=A0AAV7S1L5_PLEWA|nr:hypothetical protein NDU88_010097 [Pleurodeles waltl]
MKRTASGSEGDADQTCEADAEEQHETHPKQDKEADGFEDIRDTGQRCKEDPGKARPARKLQKPQFQDPEASHVTAFRALLQH